MSITKIVITGGPCAGKTLAMERVRQVFTTMGYNVLLIAETATQLISGGVAPWTCRSPLDYQRCQVRMQLAKEDVFAQAAQLIPAERTLIVCDRGALDTKCYVTDEQYTDVLAELGLEEEAVRRSYDAVFFLVTAANGAEEHYSLANNSTRVEPPEEAIQLDERLKTCWEPHPCFRIIDNSTDFEGKLQRLIREICDFLGEKPPFETERKFLIRRPDEHWLEQVCDSRSDIVQTYLISDEGEARVRRRGREGDWRYYHTVKHFGSGITRTELERTISREEYEQLLITADPDCRPLHKTRYCISSGGQCFEIDVYPFWDEKAVMEVELHSEDEEICFPKGIEVIREVSGEREYSNRWLAKK